MPAPSFTLVRPLREPPPHARVAVAPPRPCASDRTRPRQAEASSARRSACATAVRTPYDCAGRRSATRRCRRSSCSAASPPTATSRRSRAFPEPGWWDAQVGAGRPIDPARHHVVAIDWVGADGSIDVPIDTSDQADAVITDARAPRHHAARGVRRVLVRRDGRLAARGPAPSPARPPDRDLRHEPTASVRGRLPRDPARGGRLGLPPIADRPRWRWPASSGCSAIARRRSSGGDSSPRPS